MPMSLNIWGPNHSIFKNCLELVDRRALKLCFMVLILPERCADGAECR